MKTHSGATETWRCDACGAYNDEPLQICSDCTAKRLVVPRLSKGNKAKGKEKGLKGKKAKTKAAKKNEPKNKEVKSEEPEQHDVEVGLDKATPTEPVLSEPSLFEESLPEPSIEVESSPETEEEGKDHESYSEPSSLVAGISEPKNQAQEENKFEESQPTPEARADSNLEEPPITPQFSFSQPSSAPTGPAPNCLVFVSTPAQSLIKSKVQINFDDFPTISIGRSPENVIVIPDVEVSRTHAQLTREGDRVILKDLQSKNGTYLYNGKEFQQVNDSVELKRDSLVKFGTGTVVKFARE